MGSLKLALPPKTREWRQVVALLAGSGSAAEVATATYDAMHKALRRAADDPALVEAVWLLTQIPRAARSNDMQGALADLRIDPKSYSSPFALAAAAQSAVDRTLTSKGTHTDLGEHAALALGETLMKIAPAQTGFFANSPEDMRDALASYTKPKQFGQLARSFFGRLNERLVNYHLDCELALHRGPGRRFSTATESAAFEEALKTDCSERSRYVERFATEWYSKTRYEMGSISRKKARGFALKALNKMHAALEEAR